MELILIKFSKYFKLTTGFCHFSLWKKKLCDITFELSDDLETHLLCLLILNFMFLN